MQNQEYILTEHDLIVSKTDLNGMITFVNDDLVRITGYSRAELIGTPHNIFRHPDMPKEAFADLWSTIKSQFTWSGLVKNKTKSGGFYWVRANVTPIYENEKIIGYMSVRRKPNFDNVRKVEKIYAEMRAGKFKGKLSAGNILKDDIFHNTLRKFNNTSIKNRLVALGALSCTSLILFVLIGQSQTNSLNTNSQFYIDQIAKRANSIELARSAQVDFKEQIQEWKNTLLRGQNEADFNHFKNAFNIKNAATDEKLAQLQTLLSELGHSTQQVDALLAAHQQISNTYVNALQNYQKNNVSSITQIDSSVRSVDRNLSQDFDKLVNLLQTELNTYVLETKQFSNQVLSEANTTVNIVLIGILGSFVGLFWLLVVSIIKPLRYATDTLVHISNGNYLVRIDNFSTNEIGIMTEAMRAMSVRLGFDVAEDRKNSNEGLRLKIGLDNVDTGVIIANQNREIVYLNKSVINLLKQAETDIQKDLPNFNVDTLMGINIDTFHKNPAHQINILENLTETVTATALVGGRHMVVKASPIINNLGQRLGSVAEWKDRTAEVAVEKEISNVISAIAQGDFSERICETDKTDFFLTLSSEINHLISTCSDSLSEIVKMLSAISQGDLTQKIDANFSGVFGQLKDDTNATIQSLIEIVEQIKEAADSISTGAKEIAAGNNDLSHRTEEQAASLEETAASMEELTSTVKHNADNATQANNFSVDATGIAERGVQVVNQVVQTMDEINTASRKIGDIISVIDDIAFQTNILALNAAVEAARAGDQGKGFAVVATEVRNLAQRAAAAAGEIKHLINDSVDKVTGGTRLVSQAGDTMSEIVTSIRGVTSMMSEISAASAEQSQGIEQVNQAISQMDEVTQQNAALVEQSAAAAETLEDQVRNLSVSVAHFKLASSQKRPKKSTKNKPV
jgi:methyl-accepting chemotaxis protein